MTPTKWERLRPWALRVSVLVVAGVAAYGSYKHQQHFALNWGAETVSATLWPFSVDGLLVLASLRLLEVGSGTRWRVRGTVWAAFLLGVVVSLIANIAAAPMLTWQSVVVAGWPPIALLLAVELLSVGRHRPTTSTVDPQPSPSIQDGPTGTDTPRPSVRDGVREVLQNAGAALTNSKIVSALRPSQDETSNSRLRRNVANALWSLRKAGLVETQNGKATSLRFRQPTTSKPRKDLSDHRCRSRTREGIKARQAVAGDATTLVTAL